MKKSLGKQASFEEGEYLEAHNRPPGDTFLITTSRLVRKNAIADLIKSLHDLPSNVRLLILGTGPEMQKLKYLTENENLESRVVFLGHIDHADIPKYLKVSNIFVRPSLSEGFGNSFVEAMAAGAVPIVIGKAGPAEIIQDKKTGFLWQTLDDLEQLSVKLIQDEKLREQISRNAIKKAKDFGLDKFESEILRLKRLLDY